MKAVGRNERRYLVEVGSTVDQIGANEVGISERLNQGQMVTENSNNYSIGNHFFKVLVQIHYSQVYLRYAFGFRFNPTKT